MHRIDVHGDGNDRIGDVDRDGATSAGHCSRAGSARLQRHLGPSGSESPSPAASTSPPVSARPDATPFQQYGEGFASTSIKATGNQPSFKIVAVLDKEVVRTKPGNPGATKWDICLGAINVLNPPVGLRTVTCRRRPSVTSRRLNLMEDEGRQLRDFQGRRLLLGAPCELPEQGEELSHESGSGLFPGVLSKMKDNAGDLIITFCVPYSWDEKGGFG